MDTVKILTAHYVQIEYELAALYERIFAFLIDLVIVLVCYYLFIGALITLFEFSILDSGLLTASVWYIFPFFLVIAYHVIAETFWKGQSLAKRMLGLKVIRLDGRDPTLTNHLARGIFYVIDAGSLGIFAALLITITEKKQRLGDIIGATCVIKTRSTKQNFSLQDILKINTLEDYVPKYNQVSRLTEQDMLIIKSVISRARKYPNSAHSRIVDKTVDRICNQLDLEEFSGSKIDFLKTLIKDYIVLTR